MPDTAETRHPHVSVSQRAELLTAIAEHDGERARAVASALAQGPQRLLPGFEGQSPAEQPGVRPALEALCEAAGGTATVQRDIREAYARRPDVGELAMVLACEGLAGLQGVSPRLYTPVRPALARRYRDPQEAWAATGGGEWLLEPKLDGWECQIHMGPQGARLFSRSGRELSHTLQTVVRAVEEMLKGYCVILESEVIALDPEEGRALPCTDMQREGVSHRAAIFDLLYLDGDWTRRPCSERFKALYQLPLNDGTNRLVVTEQVPVDTLPAFERYFASVTLKGHEGIIGKRPDASYEAGSRTSRRIKVKPIDTIDAVLIGYNIQADAYLAAVYDVDADEFTPFAWVFSGLRPDEKKTLGQARDRAAIPDSPGLVVAGRSVDIRVAPLIVAEIEGDHIHPSDKYPCGLPQTTRGWTLRSTRFVRLRPDKGPGDVTSLDEFLSLPVMVGHDPPEFRYGPTAK